MPEKTAKLNIATYKQLCESLSPEVQQSLRGEEWERLRGVYERELAMLIMYAAEAAEPQIVLTTFHQSGRQSIAEFWVNDLARPRLSQINWHGQNTSQWRYAGALLIDGGRVSAHH